MIAVVPQYIAEGLDPEEITRPPGLDPEGDRSSLPWDTKILYEVSPVGIARSVLPEIRAAARERLLPEPLIEWCPLVRSRRHNAPLSRLQGMDRWVEINVLIPGKRT